MIFKAINYLLASILHVKKIDNIFNIFYFYAKLLMYLSFNVFKGAYVNYVKLNAFAIIAYHST